MMDRMPTGRTIATRTAAALAAVTLLALLAVPAASASRPEPCNGSSALCDRPFDQVTLPGSHNAMSNAELGWSKPNQEYSMTGQLERGSRAMLIDTYYGRKAGGGLVEKVEPADRDQPGVDLYLCHSICQWGSVELVEELGRVRSFLAAHPREAMVLVNESYVTPEDFAGAVERSGLIDFVYRGPTDRWPTLGEMAASGQRVVMLSEGGTGDVPWYHPAYDGILRETPYSFPAMDGGIDLLTNPASLDETCRPNRGGDAGSLFLMNHWVSGNATEVVTPDPAAAAVVNRRDAVVARARACKRRRGVKPTVLAVDFFGAGDVVGAARELNGVTAQPFLQVKRPARRAARAGRKARYRVAIANLGDAAAAPARVCATVPKRLARKPRCAKVKVPPGGSAAARVAVPTKKRARGRGTVRFTIRATGNLLRTSAKLRVKPRRGR